MAIIFVLIGGFVYMLGIGQLPDDSLAISLVIAAFTIVLIGVLYYVRIKDKREGTRYLKGKRRNRRQ